MLYFKKLSQDHISMGWLDWVELAGKEAVTEFSRIPANRQELEQILLNQSNNEIWLAVYKKEEDEQESYIGNVHISDIRWIDRKCTFGRLISPKYRGKGLGTDLTKLIIKYCFQSLGMQKVSAGCLLPNVGAQKSNERAGMEKEAVLKRERFINGEYVDVIVYGAWNS